jgi:hypothetical protein
MREDELQKIRENSRFDAHLDKYIVPPINIKNREVSLPQIKQTSELAKQ